MSAYDSTTTGTDAAATRAEAVERREVVGRHHVVERRYVVDPSCLRDRESVGETVGKQSRGLGRPLTTNREPPSVVTRSQRNVRSVSPSMPVRSGVGRQSR